MSVSRKIQVPTEYSLNARESFRVAYDLAKPTGASVVVLHIAPPTAVASDGDSPSSTPVHTEAKDVSAESLMIQAKVPAVRVEHATILADHLDANHILRIPHERGCDLIVIGTRPRTGQKHRLFGSVTADVVRRADCAFIVVMARACRAVPRPTQRPIDPATRSKP
jgi:nucleotide-binding universal stress UspA family protein